MGQYAKRIVFSVRWIHADSSWSFVRGSNEDIGFDQYTTKTKAVKIGSRYCRDLRNSEGTPTQLRVFNKNGRISFERTYGRDPRRYEG